MGEDSAAEFPAGAALSWAVVLSLDLFTGVLTLSPGPACPGGPRAAQVGLGRGQEGEAGPRLAQCSFE